MDHQVKLLTCSMLLFGGINSVIYAADFYTIIGPDGRPIIVQQNNSKKAEVNKLEKQKTLINESNNRSHPLKSDSNQSLISPSVQDKKVLEPSNHNQAIHESRVEKNPPLIRENTAETGEVTGQKEHESDHLKETLNTKNVVNTQPNTQLNTQPNTQPIFSQKSEKLNSAAEISSQSVEQKNHRAEKTSASTEAALSNQSQKVVTQNNSVITKIDGVEYVDNEYLEDREFNLEGKKRFYIMPDSSVGGSRRFETVEREKGISKSVFSKFLKNTQTDQTPVVLAQTYYRLPKKEVEQSLEQSCFSGKKIDKAKLLSLDNQEVGLWPVPPIKEKFVYEILKLDEPVQNINFSSYASSQKSPSYYWPLVVFLDQKGCVIEGVTGFKNQDKKSNNLHFSALEGVLKKPANATYLFMTPLAEAIDVQNEILTNKGQIKLSVLR